MKVKVAVNGYGTIGKRVAEAIRAMPDMELVGVGKYTPDYSAITASMNGIPIFAPLENERLFREVGVEIAGSIDELFKLADIIVDASPAGKGIVNKETYVKNGKRAIFQGGEKPHVAETSFNSLCNYSEALGKTFLRVVSCNTTGLLRIICALRRIADIKNVRAVIVRRASDPKDDKGVVNTIKLDPASIPSHHAKDVKTVLPDLDIETVAVIVPTTLMHVHVIYIRTTREVSREEVIEELAKTPRITLIDANKTGLDSTGKIIELARDIGRKRYDLYENIVWRDLISVRGDEITLVQAIHQEAIVVPENIDAIRASLIISRDPLESVRTTDKFLGVGLKI
ncbi:type II glyceraldehyde-3-phosphate dehydrogenase [Thermogladius sp. 4427co]|uniref:type II glyceraldehyde-3-phosphate dehydrogenase n=1 Tax=Thermogladius sp. 4427co TaxID=3450718 RepID=UPI003F7A3D73